MQRLDRVRLELADLGNDPASAPDPPDGVTARVTEALRGAPAHAVVGGRGARSRIRTAAAVLGVAAAVAAAGTGTAMLVRTPDHHPATGPTANRITVPSPVDRLPLTNAQLLDLLGQPADLGPLADPQRRASCLTGLGYPTSSPVLGARPLAVGDRSGVLLLLPGDTPRLVNAAMVALNCSSADTGLLAERVVTRP